MKYFSLTSRSILKAASALILGAMLALVLLPSASLTGVEAAQEPSPTRAQSTEPGYRLQIGDSIEVTYRFTPEYNQTANVLPDRTVVLQLFGSIAVSGLTLKEAQEAIHARAETRLKNPELSVTLRDYVKDHFIVLGEVTAPGRYELHGPISAVDALAMAGGFKTTSSQSTVVLVHPLSSNPEYGQATKVDFTRLKKRNAYTPMPRLVSGDILIVSTSKFARVERLIKLTNVGIYYPLPSF